MLGFWNNPKTAEQSLKIQASLKASVDKYYRIKSNLEDLQVLADLEAPQEELNEMYDNVARQIEDEELKSMLSAEGDNMGALLKINSGAGGTESNDWSAMLMRMYIRGGERNGYKVRVHDMLDGEEAGVKSVTFLVEAGG